MTSLSRQVGIKLDIDGEGKTLYKHGCSSFGIDNVLRNFKKTCVAAGIKTNDQLTIHCLRKAYGTNLANASTPAHTLKELMGHASIQTTMEFYLYSGDANEERAE